LSFDASQLETAVIAGQLVELNGEA